MVYPELYKELLAKSKQYALKSEPVPMSELIYRLYRELLAFFDMGLQKKKIIFHFYRKQFKSFYQSYYGRFGLILCDVSHLVYEYVQRDEKLFDAALLIAEHVSQSKGNDYGNGTSFDNIYSQGNIGIISRSIDKVARQRSLIVEHTQQQVQDESVLQSIIDLLNYSIYSILLVENKWNTKENIEAYYNYLRDNDLDCMIERYK